MTTATTTAFICSWCHTSDHAPSSMQPSFCTECVHATLQGRGESRKATTPITSVATPAVTTRIEYNRLNGDFDTFATADGLEIPLGSRANYFDCEALCRQYRYDAAVDGHCPEQAAAVAMEPTDEPLTRCPCGQPAMITVRTRATLHELCSPCFEEQFQCNEARTDAWEVLARVPPIPAKFPCEICHIEKTIAGFTQLRADDTHAICDDCRRQAAVRHSGADSTVSDYRCEALYELALTDLTGLRELLADRSLYQRERLAWEFSSWLLRRHGIVCEPAKIIRSWDNLIGSEEPQRAA